MDDQHGILMDTMNQLRLAVVQGAGRDQICDKLNRLLEFTRMHTASEERLLEENDFPDITEHRDAHQRMLTEIEEATGRARHNESVQLRPLIGYICGRYMEHIEGMDREYGQWLNERGIA